VQQRIAKMLLANLHEVSLLDWSVVIVDTSLVVALLGGEKLALCATRIVSSPPLNCATGVRWMKKLHRLDIPQAARCRFVANFATSNSVVTLHFPNHAPQFLHTTIENL